MKVININSSNVPRISILDIIEGCGKGDSFCQEWMYKTYAPRVMTVCRRYEHPSFGANDILQETFITAFARISTYDSEKASIETWIKRIAVNTALKAIRSRKIKYSDIELSEIDLGCSEKLSDVETVSEEVILSVISDLPDGYKTVFNMYIVDGFTHAEIAEYLGISVQTSKSQLFKAKREIRKRLGIVPKQNKSQKKV